MSQMKATIRLGLMMGVLVLLGACSGSSETAATLETLVPTTSSAPTTSVSPPTTESSTTTTTTTVVDEPAEGDFDYGDYELLWAEEGTEEADVERAFWRADAAIRLAQKNVDETGLDEAFAGEALEWQLEEVAKVRDGGWRVEDQGTREYEIGFVVILDGRRAQIQVCRYDTDLWFKTDGTPSSDTLPWETSYLSMLSKSPEGEWFVVGGTTEFDRELAEGERPSCFSDTWAE